MLNEFKKLPVGGGGKAHFEGAPTKHDVLKVDIFLISKQEIRESTDTYLVFVMVRS